MGTSTFTGPLHSGNIVNTSGTTLGQDVKNVGSAVLAQTENITQSTSDKTEIVIPAGSMIVAIEMFVTTVWDGVATTFDIGTTASGAQLIAGAAGGAVGRITVSPSTSAKVLLWKNVGTSDVRIFVNSTNAGGGAGTLVVRYIQAQGVA